MKILIITDTHGKIDRINQLAEKYNADGCIHCGDVGFFDRKSIEEMPSEELSKMLRHSHLAANEAEKIYALPHNEQVFSVLQHGISGNFEDYLSGKKVFDIPVYAVWGNHEDIRIVNMLREKPLRNLTILDEKTTVVMDKVRLYGLGGDFNEKHLTMAKKLGIPKVRNQIKSAFWQYKELLEMLKIFPQNETRIQITHCDPMENLFLESLAYCGGASLTLSGHMHRKESQYKQNMIDTEDALKPYIGLFPYLPQEISNRTIDHWNLSPAEPLILEVSGSDWQIKKS